MWHILTEAIGLHPKRGHRGFNCRSLEDRDTPCRAALAVRLERGGRCSALMVSGSVLCRHEMVDLLNLHPHQPQFVLKSEMHHVESATILHLQQPPFDLQSNTRVVGQQKL